MIVTDRNPNWQAEISNANYDCPFCGSEMQLYAPTESTHNDIYACADTMCPYAMSQDIRNVVASLQECDYEIDVIAEIVNNISIDGDQNASLFIDSRDRMEWALKRLASMDAYIKECEDVATKEIDAILTRADGLLKPIKAQRQGFYDYFSGQIESFARADMAVLKKKSAKYIYGEVKVTPTREKLHIEDTEALCKMLLLVHRDDLVRTTHAPQLVAIKADMDNLPGVVTDLIEEIPAGENVKITVRMPEGR